MEIQAIIVMSIFGGIILIGITTYILRFLKGRITIKLNKLSFYLGDKVTGSFEIFLKKPVKVNRLYYYIKADSLTTIYNNTNRNSKMGMRNKYVEEVFRFEKDCEVSQDLPSHYKNTFDISINIPNESPISNKEKNNISIGEGVNNILTGRRSFEFRNNSRLEFSVGVTLDCDGVDLSALKKIFVDVSKKNPQVSNDNSSNTQTISNQNQINKENSFDSINPK